MTALEESTLKVCESRRAIKNEQYDRYLQSSDFQDLYKEMSTGAE